MEQWTRLLVSEINYFLLVKISIGQAVDAHQMEIGKFLTNKIPVYKLGG